MMNAEEIKSWILHYENEIYMLEEKLAKLEAKQ